MLDKSQSLVRGPELVTNGDFASPTGWTVGTNWSISGGQLVGSSVPAFTTTFQSTASLVAGKTYEITYDVVTFTAGVVRVLFAGGTQATGVSRASAGSFREVLVANSGNNLIAIGSGSGGFTGVVDNLSIKEIPGNHATQATAASRPIYGINPLGGVRNQLLWTEDFTVSPWVASVAGTSTRVNTTSPYAFGLGLITATSANGGIRQIKTGLTSGQTYTLSFYMESATPTVAIVFENGAANYGSVHSANINPATGAFSSVTGFTSTSSVVFGTGHIYTLVAGPAGGNLIAAIEWRSAASGDSFLLGRPQFEAGSTATAYQKVTTQYDVTQAGVASLSYLAFDGVDDGMVTPTITPGTDKSQVFAGVRKLSDATQGIFCEFSPNTNTSNGSFRMTYPPTDGSAGYGFVTKGTIAVGATATGFAAPTTNVVTGVGDISGDVATIRVNGVERATAATDQGTGNYLAYALYLGRRANFTLPFNGNMYSLIVRFGANLANLDVTRTEEWVNGKTGAY